MQGTPAKILVRAGLGSILLLVAFSGAGASFCAETTGALEGDVSSTDGSSITGATILAEGPQGTRSSVSDRRGRFVVRMLPPGLYDVRVPAPGFAEAIRRAVPASIGRRRRLSFELTSESRPPGASSTTMPRGDITSSATVAPVPIDDFTTSYPLGHDIESTFTIGPSAVDGRGRALGEANVSISGASGLENAYRIDGVNLTSSGYGALGILSPRYGALAVGTTTGLLEEVQVVSGGLDAGVGQAGGGVVNAAVRSGGNDRHLELAWWEEPTAFEGTRGDRLNSPNIANEVASLRRDLLLTVGGPVSRDRLFYLLAYDRVALEQEFKLTSGDAELLYDLDGDGTATDRFDVGETIRGGRTPATVTRRRTSDNYAGKLSWLAGRNHRLELTAFGDPSRGPVGPQDPTTFLRHLADPIGSPDPDAGATGLDWGGDQRTPTTTGSTTAGASSPTLIRSSTSPLVGRTSTATAWSTPSSARRALPACLPMTRSGVTPPVARLGSFCSTFTPPTTFACVATQSTLVLLLDLFNLLDDDDALLFDDLVEARPGTSNPDYLRATRFQEPRNVRIGARFGW